MIVQERETQAETIRFKALRLITPERARRLSIPAEGPVFVSPAQNSHERCQTDDCTVVFKPLVYYPGLVKPHHFHRFGGGIYYFEGFRRSDGYFNWLLQGYHAGWVAMLEPRGNTFKTELPNCYSSEEVWVKGIRAFCVDLSCMGDSSSREIKSGVVVDQDGNSQFLVPICGLDQHPEYRKDTRYTFKITDDGEVLFSSI